MAPNSGPKSETGSPPSYSDSAIDHNQEFPVLDQNPKSRQQLEVIKPFRSLSSNVEPWPKGYVIQPVRDYNFKLKFVQHQIPDVREQMDIIEGVNLLPHPNDGEVLHPLQLPQRSSFWEMAFIISSTSLSEKSFELELELVIAKLREFSLEDPEIQNICEEHNST